MEALLDDSFDELVEHVKKLEKEMNTKELKYDITDKEFLKIFKLFSSSLFSRKQRYLYISRTIPMECFYSTMLPEDILFNKPSIDDVVHKVVCKEVNIFKLFEQYIPFDMLTSDSYCLNLLEVATLIREQNTKEAITSNVFVDERELTLSCKKIRKIDKVDTEVIIPVVYRTSCTEMSLLQDMIASISVWVSKVNNCLKPLSYSELGKGQLNYIDISNPGNNVVCNTIKIPHIDGFNTVSICEYAKKQNTLISTNKGLSLKIGQFGSVVKCYYEYEDDIVKITSIHPSAFYYNR